MAGDVDELAFTGHVRAAIEAGALLERGVVGPVDQHHAQVEAGHADAAERLAAPRLQPIPPRLGADLPGRDGHGCAWLDRRPLERFDTPLVALREFVLLPV